MTKWSPNRKICYRWHNSKIIWLWKWFDIPVIQGNSFAIKSLETEFNTIAAELKILKEETPGENKILSIKETMHIRKLRSNWKDTQVGELNLVEKVKKKRQFTPTEKPIIIEEKLIPNHQFCFRDQHSTLEQVLRIVEATEGALKKKDLYSSIPECVVDLWTCLAKRTRTHTAA